MTAAEILRAARERIADEDNWTTGYLAVDEFNIEADPSGIAACAWCALGAIESCQPDHALRDRVVDMLTKSIPDGEDLDVEDPVADYNDRHEHADVIALFDRAVALAEGGAS